MKRRNLENDQPKCVGTFDIPKITLTLPANQPPSSLYVMPRSPGQQQGLPSPTQDQRPSSATSTPTFGTIQRDSNFLMPEEDFPEQGRHAMRPMFRVSRFEAMRSASPSLPKEPNPSGSLTARFTDHDAYTFSAPLSPLCSMSAPASANGSPYLGYSDAKMSALFINDGPIEKKEESHRKGPWTKQEDEMLLFLVNKYGAQKWSSIAKHIPFRVGKQCRERYFNHLAPEVRREAWTSEEDEQIVKYHATLGNRWTEIAKALGNGRPPNAVKNRWNSALKKRNPSDIAALEVRNADGNLMPQGLSTSMGPPITKTTFSSTSSSPTSLSPPSSSEAMSPTALTAQHGKVSSYSHLLPPTLPIESISGGDGTQIGNSANTFVTKPFEIQSPRRQQQTGSTTPPTMTITSLSASLSQMKIDQQQQQQQLYTPTQFKPSQQQQPYPLQQLQQPYQLQQPPKRHQYQQQQLYHLHAPIPLQQQQSLQSNYQPYPISQLLLQQQQQQQQDILPQQLSPTQLPMLSPHQMSLSSSTSTSSSSSSSLPMQNFIPNNPLPTFQNDIDTQTSDITLIPQNNSANIRTPSHSRNRHNNHSKSENGHHQLLQQQEPCALHMPLKMHKPVESDMYFTQDDTYYNNDSGNVCNNDTSYNGNYAPEFYEDNGGYNNDMFMADEPFGDVGINYDAPFYNSNGGGYTSFDNFGFGYNLDSGGGGVDDFNMHENGDTDCSLGSESSDGDSERK